MPINTLEASVILNTNLQNGLSTGVPINKAGWCDVQSTTIVENQLRERKTVIEEMAMLSMQEELKDYREATSSQFLNRKMKQVCCCYIKVFLVLQKGQRKRLCNIYFKTWRTGTSAKWFRWNDSRRNGNHQNNNIFTRRVWWIQQRMGIGRKSWPNIRHIKSTFGNRRRKEYVEMCDCV